MCERRWKKGREMFRALTDGTARGGGGEAAINGAGSRVAPPRRDVVGRSPRCAAASKLVRASASRHAAHPWRAGVRPAPRRCGVAAPGRRLVVRTRPKLARARVCADESEPRFGGPHAARPRAKRAARAHKRAAAACGMRARRQQTREPRFSPSQEEGGGASACANPAAANPAACRPVAIILRAALARALRRGGPPKRDTSVRPGAQEVGPRMVDVRPSEAWG